MVEAPAMRHQGILLTMNDKMPEPPPADSGLIQEIYYPKLYLNGFPKSGLHLSVLMALCLVPDSAHGNPWAGTYDRRGWSTEWMPDWRIYKHLSRIHENGYMKGHSGYRDDIALFLWQQGTAMAFIYRDLRDVAISMSYHVIAEDDQKFSHDDKDLFRALPTHEDVILACIRGIADYPGLIERWVEYAPWLSVPWVHKLRYEDMRHKPHETAVEFIKYVYDRTGKANGVGITMPVKAINEAADGMVKAMGITDASPTFRKGKTGGWVEHWTPAIDRAFRETGGADWLIKLGYEDDDNW